MKYITLFLLLGVYNLMLYMVRYQFFALRHKYDAARTEDLIVASNELVSSSDTYFKRYKYFRGHVGHYVAKEYQIICYIFL